MEEVQGSMKRQVTQSKKVEIKTLIAPSFEGWALWEFDPRQSSPHLKQSATQLEELASLEKAIFALPVRYVFCLPLWLNTADKSLLSDLIFAQLERRGLLTRSREETVMNYQSIKVEEDKTLILAFILPAQLPENFLNQSASAYDVSARFYPLASNQLTLWREAGRLTVAFTHQETLVYCQTLSGSELNTAVLQELFCLYLELESERVFQEMEGFTLWGNFSTQEIQQVQATFHVTPHTSEMPAPRLPEQILSLTPPSIQQAKILQIKEERNKKILRWALVGYGIFLSIWIAQLLFFYGKTYWIRRDVKKNAVLVQSLKETASRWNAIGTALQPERYALEILYQCASLLPKEGVRFTVFEITDSEVVLRGEASSVAAASDFFEKLKQNTQLLSYQWAMPPPQILPNDTAQFQITGSRYDAPTQPQ